MVPRENGLSKGPHLVKRPEPKTSTIPFIQLHFYCKTVPLCLLIDLADKLWSLDE